MVRRLFMAVAGIILATSAIAQGSQNPPRPIGSNYLYFSDTAKALEYLAGGTISGTAANLTGVTAMAANVQQTFPTISGALAGSGSSQTMTIGFSVRTKVPVGEHIAIAGVSPASWNESCVVTASSAGSVTCLNPKASGTYSGNGLFIWNNSSFPALAHAHGMSAIDFDGGSCPTSGCLPRIAYQASVGIDVLMIDEPGAGQSGWPAIVEYWKAQRPGGFFGMTTGDDSGDIIRNYVLPPYNVPLDYASAEDYVNIGGDYNPFIMDGLTTSDPKIKTIALLYGTMALCDDYGRFPLSSFNVIGFWDVDGYGPLANTGYMDYNWLQNAQIYARTGSAASICNLAVSFFAGDTPRSGSHQSSSFVVNTADNMENYHSPYYITYCEYSVYAGANIAYGLDDPSVVQTVPWTTKPCNGHTS